MTHPEILEAERFGSRDYDEKIHICCGCECRLSNAYDDIYFDIHNNSFCEDCYRKYYDIQEMGA